MNLEKKYHDMEGKERNILEMVRLHPEWAANMIQMKEGWKSPEEIKHDEFEKTIYPTPKK